jgi:cell division protein ZapA (FtsZ GTPase activity inhibitor)
MTPKKADNLAERPVSAGELSSTKVTVCGEAVQLRTDQSPEVVQRLAAYINAKVRAAGGGAGLTPDNFRVLALAALGITGELFETKARLEENDKSSQSMLATAQSLTDSLDRALAHSK